MRASVYNNPLFAEGLASVLDNYLCNPDRERRIAQDELSMQEGWLGLEEQQLRNEMLRKQVGFAGLTHAFAACAFPCSLGWPTKKHRHSSYHLQNNHPFFNF